MKRNKYIHERLLIWGEYMRNKSIPSFISDKRIGFGSYDNARLLSVEVGSVRLSQINHTLQAVESLDRVMQDLLVVHYIERLSIREIADFEVVGYKTIHNRLCAADVSIQTYFDGRRSITHFNSENIIS